MFGFIYSLIVGTGLYWKGVKDGIKDNKTQISASNNNQKTYTDHDGRSRWTTNGRQVYTYGNQIKDIKTGKVYYDYEAENLKRNINKALAEGRTVLRGSEIPQDTYIWNRKDCFFVYDIVTGEIFREIFIMYLKKPKQEIIFTDNGYQVYIDGIPLNKTLIKKEKKIEEFKKYKVLIDKNCNVIREADGEIKITTYQLKELQDYIDQQLSNNKVKRERLWLFGDL